MSAPAAMWWSDPRTCEFLLRGGERRGGRIDPALRRKVAFLKRQAPFLADDAAMLLYAAARRGDLEPVAPCLLAWLHSCWTDGEVRRRLWQDHRGVVLSWFEAVARSPSAWRCQEAEDARGAILALGRREAREGVSLRNGTSFQVVEALVERLADDLEGGARAGPRLRAAAIEAQRYARADWGEARRAVQFANRSFPRTDRHLGVPFADVLPDTPDIAQLAAEFATAARQDVTLYDRAPLAVAIAGVGVADAGIPAAALLDAAADGWDSLVQRTLDLAQGAA